MALLEELLNGDIWKRFGSEETKQEFRKKLHQERERRKREEHACQTKSQLRNLYQALCTKDIEKSSFILEQMLEKKMVIDPNFKDKEGRTLFHIAIMVGNLEIVQEIKDLSQTENIIDAQDNKGYTALHYAIMMQETDTVKSDDIIDYLLAQCPNVSLKSEEGYTAYDVLFSLHLMNYGRFTLWNRVALLNRMYIQWKCYELLNAQEVEYENFTPPSFIDGVYFYELSSKPSYDCSTRNPSSIGISTSEADISESSDSRRNTFPASGIERFLQSLEELPEQSDVLEGFVCVSSVPSGVDDTDDDQEEQEQDYAAVRMPTIPFFSAPPSSVAISLEDSDREEGFDPGSQYRPGPRHS